MRLIHLSWHEIVYFQHFVFAVKEIMVMSFWCWFLVFVRLSVLIICKAVKEIKDM
jgi:hypothetical protein